MWSLLDLDSCVPYGYFRIWPYLSGFFGGLVYNDAVLRQGSYCSVQLDNLSVDGIQS